MIRIRSSIRSVLISLSFLLVHAAGGPATAAWASQPDPICDTAVGRAVESVISEPVGALSGVVRHVAGDFSRPISFGLEIEVNLAENPLLVNDFRLAHVSEPNWTALSQEERVTRARAWVEKYKHHPNKLAFRRLKSADPRLPALLEIQAGGNIELNGLVFSTLEEASDFLTRLESRIGQGSYQGHVAFRQAPMPGSAGYVVFEGDHAQLATLQRNYRRYLENQKNIPGRNLTHHSLGPLGDRDRIRYLELENLVSRNEPIGHPGKSRTFYGPALRGDSYPDGIIGFELRQFHRRREELLKAMDDLSAELAADGGLRRYETFSEVRLIHSRLPSERAAGLKLKVDPTQWRKYFENLARKVRQRFPDNFYGAAPSSQRFYFPLRDWASHPIVAGLPATERSQAIERINRATRAFIKDTDALVKSGAADAAAMERMQILVSRWADEADLTKYFDEFAQSRLPSGSSAAQTVAKSPQSREATQTAGLPQSPRLPQLPMMSRRRIRKLPDGRELPVVLFDANKTTDPAYSEFLMNTVEMLYRPGTPSGRMALRVGDRVYRFGATSQEAIMKFDPLRMTHGETGVVFSVPRSRIESAREDLDFFYESSKSEQLPPFDYYSEKVKLDPVSSGRFRLTARWPGMKNIWEVDAKIVEDAEGSRLIARNGMECDVLRGPKGGRFIQGYSCASSAAFSLKKMFGIDLPDTGGAFSMIRGLVEGNPGKTAPGLIIEY